MIAPPISIVGLHDEPAADPAQGEGGRDDPSTTATSGVSGLSIRVNALDQRGERRPHRRDRRRLRKRSIRPAARANVIEGAHARDERSRGITPSSWRADRRAIVAEVSPDFYRHDPLACRSYIARIRKRRLLSVVDPLK